MPKMPAEFDSKDVEIIERNTVYRGFFSVEKLQLRHKLFAGGWGQEISRELFVRGNAVAAVLYDPDNDLIGLIEQFRVGALEEESGPWCLEVVAGMFNGDEKPEEVIRRELIEEADFKPRELIPICHYLSTPGGCNERIYLYCALGNLVGAEGLYGLSEEAEDIRLKVVAAQSVFDVMLQGRMNNAATLIGLQWLQLNREMLSTKYSRV